MVRPRIGLERPPARCIWCGSPARPVGGRLARCEACGAATTYPAPDDVELEQAYNTWYRPGSGRFAAGGDELLARSRATLARRVDRRAPVGPVLDVGSGDGVLLDALHARGREALGLERESLRSDVYACELADFEQRRGEWAAVVMWHTLEHLREPAAGLDRAAELLVPGGLLVLAVPNLDSWQARLLGDRWLALDLPRHMVHLPAAALVDRVRSRGFRVERISHWRGGQIVFGWLHGLVGSLPGHVDLYAAIRQPGAREQHLTAAQRVRALAAGVALFPVALALSGAEIAARAGGSVCVEARRL
jgi:SAM-dependent methyltransferase